MPSDELLPFTIDRRQPVCGTRMLTESSVDQVMLCFTIELTQSVSSYKEGPELFKIQNCNIPGEKVKLTE